MRSMSDALDAGRYMNIDYEKGSGATASVLKEKFNGPRT